MDECIEKCQGPVLPERILIRGVNQEKLQEKMEVITAVIENAQKNRPRDGRSGGKYYKHTGPEQHIRSFLDHILDSNRQYNELDCDAKLPGIYERDTEFKSSGVWGECRDYILQPEVKNRSIPHPFQRGPRYPGDTASHVDGYTSLYKMNEQICFTLRIQWGHHLGDHDKHLFMIDFFVQDDDYLDKWPVWYVPHLEGNTSHRKDAIIRHGATGKYGPILIFPSVLFHLNNILPYIHAKKLLPLFHIWAIGEDATPSFSDELKWNITKPSKHKHDVVRLDSLHESTVTDAWGMGRLGAPEYAIDNPYELPGFKVIPHDLEIQRLNLSKLLSERLSPDELLTQDPEVIKKIAEQLKLHKGTLRRQKKRKSKKKRKSSKKRKSKKKRKSSKKRKKTRRRRR